MPRLFVAVKIPQPIQDQLRKLYTPIPTARWVDFGSIHITLKFIGEVSDPQVAGIKTALHTFNTQAFDLFIEGVGTFPKRKPPRVLWVGLHHQPKLLTLQAKVESALGALGFPPEDRPFSPHLTLARLKTEKPLQQVTQFLQDHATLKLSPFHVTEFALIKSVLSPQGARYTDVAHYSLEGTDE